MGLPKFGHIYRLTREPELTYSQAGLAICKVGLACSEKYGEKETQLFIDITAFKKTAEMLATVQKGHRIHAYLKLQTESWQDQATGQKRSKISAIVDSFEFIEPKQQGQQPQQQGGFRPQQSSGGYVQNQSSGYRQPPNDFGTGGQQEYNKPHGDGIPF